MRYTRIRVIGPSMEPALRNGEWWVARRTSSIKPGQIVVVEHPRRPGLIVVKRAVRRTEDGWWVEGDNPTASDDSREFGSVPDANVIGRLTWRYRPLLRRP